MAHPAARELNGKRKRERMAEEDDGESKVTKTGEEENMCPNGIMKTTPVRKVKGQTKGSQRLFASGTGKRHMYCFCLLVQSALCYSWCCGMCYLFVLTVLWFPSL